MENKTKVSCDNTECVNNANGTLCTASTVNLQMTWIGSIEHWKLKCKSFLHKLNMSTTINPPTLATPEVQTTKHITEPTTHTPEESPVAAPVKMKTKKEVNK